ncbi:MAG: ATP-binding cassette domain-containing protein [Candidatus Magnetoovum sp. WYHC-5]|nr:ATP-binding cassette domain-containing protein [Candidatus Magnetoovum sp. WYHC-5]
MEHLDKTLQIVLSVQVNSMRYADGTQALSNININITSGAFVGLLGANGSGKTTLLKVMDGLIKDYNGASFLYKDDIRRLSPSEIYRKVGMVFQNPNDQLFASTVFEDVSFGPINMGFETKEVINRVNNALQAVDMIECAQKNIHNLSYGQKKRACIAGLLAMGHEILLLDEPTEGLDPVGEYKMMDILKKLNKECRVTIVMATHSVDLIPLFLDSLYVLSSGCIVCAGKPEDVFSTPHEMAEVKLRLPQIAELFYKLKQVDKLPLGKLPLTIGEARREIVGLLSIRLMK